MEKDNHSTEIGIARDLSGVHHTQLIEQVIALARANGVEEVSPGENFQNDPFALELQQRLQHVQSFEDFYPEKIQIVLVDGLHRKYESKSRGLSEFRSIDHMTTNIGRTIANLETLNELGLSKVQQVLFLRGIIIATSTQAAEVQQNPKKRFSEERKALQKRALYSLRHLATNRIHVPERITSNSQARFSVAYTAGYLARMVELELYAQGPLVYQTAMVDEAMHIPIPFGQLSSGDQEEVVSVFPPGVSESGEPEKSGYTPIHPVLIDEARIRELRDLQNVYGNPLTVFRYYESMQPFRRNGNGGSGEDNPKTEREDREPTEKGTYLVLVIEHTDPDNDKKVHVVADNRQVGNACYALRQEVLDEWEHLIGIRLNWRDIFTQSRQTARQLGARDFRHNKGSDVKQRVHDYLYQEPESLVLETFSAIFNKREKELFDDNMQPTEHNHMPALMIGLIQRSQILRELWPAIREHGYQEAVRAKAADEQLEAKTSDRASARQETFKDRARKLFADVVKTDARIMREERKKQ